MDWDDLRVFLTAVRAGSYTAAGQQLNINRTTVGRRITGLEEKLDVILFRETPSGPEPTPKGALLLAAAARMESHVAALMRALGEGDGDATPIRIASSAGIATEFMADIAGHARDHGGLCIELTNAADPIEAVTQRRADLAIALVRAVPRRLAGVRIGPVSQALYARRGGARTPLGWGAEAELALPHHWVSANAPPQGGGTSRFNSFPALRQAVLDGLGSAWLWCFAADAEPALEQLAPPDPRYDSSLWLLHRADTTQSAAATALTRFLGAAVAKRIGAA
jgi:DNA-binding transcriptional LysR family regulator